MFEVTPVPEGLKHVRFIASDMDGSLLTNASVLPEGFEERVDALASVGTLFSAASGRPLYTLEDNLGHLGHKIMLIGDNGGVISRNGKVIYQADLPVEEYRRMARITHEKGDVGLICGVDACYVEPNAKPYEDYFRTFYTRVVYVDDLAQVDAPADKYTVYFPNNDASERQAEYAAAIGGDYTFACGGIMWLDVMPEGVSKGNAMRRISELCGIGLDEILAFGDAPNDADMLETVGFGYMMANAQPCMANHASLVAPSNEDRGVLQVIDQVVAARQAI